ncbi:MAG: hypothetical protein JSS57_26775, partial [Proteobacteria bacterium]|nr:hypothetical protein [Pseudomonadota bacterium]
MELKGKQIPHEPAARPPEGGRDPLGGSAAVPGRRGAVTVHDMTLRDGMHPKRHLMTLEQMKSIATGLDEAGVPLI